MNNLAIEKRKTLAISDLLFTHDPAHTCCVENDCFDEYDAIAATIVSGNEPLNKILEEAFGYEVSVDETVAEAVKEILNES